MSRIKIEFPSQVAFTTEIPIRITDLNYAAHVGNDTILSIIHELRMQWLAHFGYTNELSIEGIGLIMSDVAIEFKSELFYGDSITGSLAVQNITRIGFDLYYRLEKRKEHSLVALAKTGMVCFDYNKRKIVTVPRRLNDKLQISNPK